jgi:heme-degrading monooxygenase HmoA
MMTIVTDIRLKQGAESRWDSTMRERMMAAEHQLGWVSGQLLSPAEEPLKRVIVGTWSRRGDWQRWHDDPQPAEPIGLQHQRFAAAPSTVGSGVDSLGLSA